MTVSLQSVFLIRHLSALKNPPDRAIGGFVFIMTHYDSMESYWYHSINYQSPSGDSGWQSNRFYSREEANAAAEVLADWCGAEVVWP
jgi:hypothetical protein